MRSSSSEPSPNQPRQGEHADGGACQVIVTMRAKGTVVLTMRANKITFVAGMQGTSTILGLLLPVSLAERFACERRDGAAARGHDAGPCVDRAERMIIASQSWHVCAVCRCAVETAPPCGGSRPVRHRLVCSDRLSSPLCVSRSRRTRETRRRGKAIENGRKELLAGW